MLPLPNYTEFDFSFLIELSWYIAQFFSSVINVLTKESFYTLIRRIPFIDDVLESVPILDNLLENIPLLNEKFIWFIFGYAVYVAITTYVLRVFFELF